MGLSSIITNTEILTNGDNAPYVTAARLIDNNTVIVIIKVFVVISCLGTLNGLIMGGARGLYTLTDCNLRPKPNLFKKLNPKTNISVNSSFFGFAFVLFFLLDWRLEISVRIPQLSNMDELCIALLYSSYIAIYL